jgi:hypothetical protein
LILIVMYARTVDMASLDDGERGRYR